MAKLKYKVVDLKRAVDAVNNGASYSSASKLFGVPKATVYRHHKDPFQSNCPGPTNILTKSEETELIAYIQKFTKRGMPTRRAEIVAGAVTLLKRRNSGSSVTPGRFHEANHCFNFF